jgi:hypothetical protein
MPDLPDDFDDLVRRTRARLQLPVPIEAYDGDEDEDVEPVQISFRVPPRLRHDLAQVAAQRRQSVTAFVTDALEEAVRIATDPFAGLAARMTAQFRAELGDAVDSGAYAEAAAEADRAEGWDR